MQGGYVHAELLAAGEDRKLFFSRPELIDRSYLRKLCQEPVFTLVMQGRVDISKAKPVEVIVACMRTGNCTGLQYALAQGWVADKQALRKLAAKHSINHPDVLTWLQTP